MSDTELMVVDGDVQVDVVGDAGPHMTMLQPLTVGEIEQRYAMLQRFRHAVLRDGVDYGAAGGAEGKPSLLQPGAQKLVVLFGLRAEFTIEDQDEDWTGERHSGEPFFRYRIKCRLYTGDGALAGESYGDINSWESRYRWRWMDEFELPPDHDPGKLRRKISSAEEFEFAIKKGETGGKYGKSPAYWSAWRKAINDGKALPVTITTSKGQQYPGYRMETVRYRVPNDDVFSQINTMIKIGQKRCLGSSTPVMVKTSRGVSCGDLDMVWTLWKNGNETIYFPGIDGGWRKVTGMIQDTNRVVFRIDLSDGSHIRATAEHRFPTERGLQTVSDLKVGDRLLRSIVPIEEPAHGALPAIGYLVGLFIAEGNLVNGTAVRYTLNSAKTDDFAKITEVAQMLGCTVNTTEKVGNCFTVNVYGPPFFGLIKHFVAGNLSYGKHLTAYAWRQGRAFLEQVLAGYLSGDGSYTTERGKHPFWRITFTGKNWGLAQDLRALCNMLGYRFSLRRSSAKLKGVAFPTFTGWIKPSVTTYNQKCLTEIVQIQEENRPGTVYDIEVDGDHLFCLADGIQTHNSLVGAVLNTTGASEFFTQDLEDFSDDDREMMLRRGERTLESGDRQPDGETGQSETGTQRQPRNVGGNGNGQPEQGNAATGWRAGEGAAMIPALRKLTGLGTADLLAALDTAGSTVNPGMKAEQIAAALKGGTPPVPPTTSGPSKPSAKTPPAPTLPMDADELKARAEPITDPFVYLEAVQARQEKHAALTGEIGAKSRMEIAKLIADAMPDSSPEENVETQAALVRFLFQHTEGLKALSKCEGAVMLDMLTTEDGTVHPWAKSEIEAVVAFLADVDAEEGDHAG